MRKVVEDSREHTMRDSNLIVLQVDLDIQNVMYVGWLEDSDILFELFRILRVLVILNLKILL